MTRKRSDLLLQSAAVVLAIMTVLLHLQGLRFSQQPTIYADEAGYWTHAAALAGLDWTGVSGGLSWYSYGYSFLLMPLLWIFDEGAALYHAALILNAVMMGLVFLILRMILRRLFPQLHPAVSIAAAFAGALYTPYQIYSMTTWAETAVLLTSALMLLLLWLSLDRPSFVRLGALGAVSAYAFMVHNRCIGLILAMCFVLLLSVIGKRISLRYAVCFLAVLALGLGADRVLRHYLTDLLWHRNLPSGNDAGNVVGKLRLAFTSFSGFKAWLSVICSQGFAAIVSGFGLPALAFLSIGADLCRKLAKHLHDGKEAVLTKDFLMQTYLLCSFLAMLLISATFMLTYIRADHIVYTRYIDCTVGVACAYGLCRAAQGLNRRDLWMLPAVVGLLWLGANRAAALVGNLDSDIFVIPCASVMADLWAKYGQDFFSYAFLAIIPLTVAVSLCVLLPKYRNAAGVISAAVLSFTFCCHTGAGTEQLRASQKALTPISELTVQLQDTATPIYALTSCGTAMNLIQFDLPRQHVIGVADITQVPEGAYVFAPSSDAVRYEDCTLLDSSSRIVLLQKAEITNAPAEVPLEMMYTFEEACYLPEENSIVSTSGSPYLCYGPYLTLEPGEYTFTLSMTPENLPETEEPVGYAALVCGQEIYAQTYLTAASLSEDVTLAAELTEPEENMEIIVFLYDPSATVLRLNAIYCEEEP